MSNTLSPSILDKLTVASKVLPPTELPRSKVYRARRRQMSKVDPLVMERKEQSRLNASEVSKELQKAVEVLLVSDPQALLCFKNRVKLSLRERKKKITVTMGLIEALGQHPAMAYHLRCTQEKTKRQVLNRPVSKPDPEAVRVANELLFSITEIHRNHPQLLLDFKFAQERDCRREDKAMRMCLRAVLWCYARGNFVEAMVTSDQLPAQAIRWPYAR